MNARYLFLLGFLTLITYSCDNVDFPVQDDYENAYTRLDELQSSSVHKNVGYDWENNTTVKIQGQDIILPWYSGAPANLPEHIFTDYKKRDGWIMIYNFITDKNVNLSNRYVFIFYNVFRGLMRIYYYNTLFPSQAGTSFAQITIHDQNTRLFNSSTTGRACLPMDQQGSKTVYACGISATPVSGFYYGWNCFEVELSYDQYLKDKNVSMSISFYDRKIMTIKITGGVDIKGIASYVTTNTSNPAGNFTQGIFNSIASVAGNAVKDVINPPKKPTSKVSVLPILGSIASSVISKTISAVTQSWTSTWGKTDSIIKTIDVKLAGKMNMSGAITENLPPPAIPIQNILVPGALPGASILLPIDEKELGVWNIKTNKTVCIGNHTYPTIENYSHYPMNDNDYPVTGDFCEYIYVETPTYGKNDVVLNKEVLKKIEKYEVQSTMFYKESEITDTILIDQEWVDKKYYKITKYRYQFYKSYWQMVNSDNFERKETPNFYFNEKAFKFVAKVTLLLYPKAPYNTDVISLTRTFDCKTEKITTPSKGRARLGAYYY